MARTTTKTKKDEHDPTKAPAHLKESREFFEYIMREFIDFEEHHRRLLVLACEAWDRCVQARTMLAKDGITFVDRHGSIKPHPGIAIEKDSRIAFARMIREIGLDITDADSRPPALPANKR